jgi:hypothetical protein
LLLREWRITNPKRGKTGSESDENKMNPALVYYVGTALRRARPENSSQDGKTISNPFELMNKG